MVGVTGNQEGGGGLGVVGFKGSWGSSRWWGSRVVGVRGSRW